MSVHSIQRKKRRDPARVRYKYMGSHDEFLSRITKTLYYGELPSTDRFSLPVTELAAELFSEVKSGRSLDRLRLEQAAEITRNACISPCSFVLAMLYLERLKISNPEYVDHVNSSDLFLVSSLVASKYLNDDGSDDDVMNCEWATSANIELKDLNSLEKHFLNAINWEVFVKESEFWRRLAALEREVALREGRKRGWFSYTDMDSLLDGMDSTALAHTLFSASMVCMAGYVAGMLTVLGSGLLVSSLPLCNLGSLRPSLQPYNQTSPSSLAQTSLPYTLPPNIPVCLPSNTPPTPGPLLQPLDPCLPLPPQPDSPLPQTNASCLTVDCPSKPSLLNVSGGVFEMGLGELDWLLSSLLRDLCLSSGSAGYDPCRLPLFSVISH